VAEADPNAVARRPVGIVPRGRDVLDEVVQRRRVLVAPLEVGENAATALL
jgi:hypothetical protein